MTGPSYPRPVHGAISEVREARSTDAEDHDLSLPLSLSMPDPRAGPVAFGLANIDIGGRTRRALDGR